MSASHFFSSQSASKTSENEQVDSFGPSARYFSPDLQLASEWNEDEYRQAILSEVLEQLKTHVIPWLSVQRSVVRHAFRVGLYERLGSGRSSWEWIRDLHAYLNEQTSKTSDDLIFFAVFPDSLLSTYSEFEHGFDHELQFLLLGDALGEARFAKKHPISHVQARVHLGPGSVTMLGMHPDHPDLSRRFPFPVIVVSRDLVLR